MQRQQKTNPRQERERTNDQIRVPQVQVIDQNGTNLGVISTAEAKRLASQAELDLVEVNSKKKPPVCKILDYGKMQYSKQKKQHAAKKKQHQVKTKGIRVTPNTEENDLKTKVNQARKFLEKGNKVAIEVRFKGREMRHTERGREIIDTLVTETQDIADVEGKVQLQDRRMTLTLKPANKPKKAKEDKKAIAS